MEEDGRIYIGPRRTPRGERTWILYDSKHRGAGIVATGLGTDYEDAFNQSHDALLKLLGPKVHRSGVEGK